jgi:hypothetical protein
MSDFNNRIASIPVSISIYSVYIMLANLSTAGV